MSAWGWIVKVVSKLWKAKEEIAFAVDDIQGLVKTAKKLAKKGDTGKELREALEKIAKLAEHGIEIIDEIQE